MVLMQNDRSDQAAQLREMTLRRHRSALILAIMSGKGGVGKSNVAVNLSICLSERGLRTVLMDLDMGLANADLLMNLRPRYTLAHLVAGVRTIEEITVRGPAGIRFIPGASGTQGLANLTEFERQNLISQLHKLDASADIIVFDLGAGISRNVTSFAHAANCLWIVTTPEPTALTDAYAAVKALQREQCRAGITLVVNMTNSREEAQAAYRRVAGVARKFLNFSIAYGGYMLQDTAVELAVQARCPFVIRYPGSNASACIAAMASEVARSCAASPRRSGFFQRVAGLFV